MIDEGEVEPIAPENIRYLPIVRAVEDGYSIVDGTHRIASMHLYDDDRRANIPVLVVDGPPGWWKQIDCDSVIGSHPVLDAIYEAASRR